MDHFVRAMRSPGAGRKEELQTVRIGIGVKEE